MIFREPSTSDAPFRRTRFLGLAAPQRRRWAPLSVTCVPAILALASPTLFAADESSSDAPLEEVVVTGTNIKGVAPVGSEAVTLTRDDVLATGLTDLHSVLRALPQVVDTAPSGVANYREGGTTAYGGNVTQGTAINLRGLGAQATLTLVDGHRITPTGTQGVFTEANQLPLAALGRIEIIADGNSAIYGSDAIGGVVNFVMRKDFEGVEATTRATFVDGYNTYGASLTGGTTWQNLGPLGRGNVILAYDYERRDPMRASASAFLSDVSQYGGVDNRVRGGQNTTGAVNGGVGAGQPGTTSTPGATSNVNWCDNWNPGFPPFVPASCASGTYLYRGLASGTAVPTFAQTSATPSLSDRATEKDYLGRRWRHQVATFFNQQLTDSLELSLEGFWTKRDVFSRDSQWSSLAPMNITVQPGSPFYVAPPGTAGGPMVVNYSASGHGVPLWSTDNPDKNYTMIAGLNLKLFGDWTGDLSYSYGRDKTCGICQIGTNVDVGALQHQVNIGAINPLSSTPLTPEQLATFVGTNIQLSSMGIDDAMLKLNGSLFNVPGGAVKLAFGGEHIRNTQSVSNGANRTDIPAEGIQESSLPPPQGSSGVGCSSPLPCPPRTQPNQFAWDNINGRNRTISSGFVEVYVPIVSRDMGVPLVQSLSLDAAERYDDYSDFGSTTNPKIGLTWAVNNQLSFRGSWGTSFRAPSLTDINPFVFSVKIFSANFPNLSGATDIDGIPISPTLKLTNAALVSGDQPDIRPETARNWSVGFDLTPEWLEGFKISSTYYTIKYEDQIFSPPVFPGALLNPAVYQLYKDYVHPVHNPANCTPGTPSTYDPALLPFVDAIGIYGIVTSPQLCQVQVWIDGRLTNIGSSTQSGADLNMGYVFQSALGNWNLNLDVTRALEQKIAAISTVPETSVLGNIGNLIKWRGRGSAAWSRNALSASLFMNYVGHYLNNTPLTGHPVAEVPSWITFDVNLGYDFGQAFSGSSALSGTRLSVSAQNVFDRDPPVVLLGGGGQFDANNANVYGRMMSVQLSKKF